MSEMLTAEEFLWDKRNGNGFHDHELPDLLIEFAKLHVEAALKEASEKAHHYHVATWKCEPKGIQPEVNKDSILNAYPLENIK